MDHGVRWVLFKGFGQEGALDEAGNFHDVPGHAELLTFRKEFIPNLLYIGHAFLDSYCGARRRL